jgi:adenylate cyclase
VLEGSIRKDVSRIRVTGKLVDALSGKHIWAEKFDRTLHDIFAVQEELTHSIVSAIAPHINASEFEKARRRRPNSVIAYEIAMCARFKAWEAHHKSDRILREEAIFDARAALAIDARSTVALIALAFAQWQHVAYATTTDRQAAWVDGVAAAERAIEVDPSEAWGYVSKGLLLAHAPDRDRTDDTLQNLRRAHELNPHDTSIQTGLGFAETMAGHPHDAIALLEQALRLKPTGSDAALLTSDADDRLLRCASVCEGRRVRLTRHQRIPCIFRAAWKSSAVSRWARGYWEGEGSAGRGTPDRTRARPQMVRRQVSLPEARGSAPARNLRAHCCRLG